MTLENIDLNEFKKQIVGISHLLNKPFSDTIERVQKKLKEDGHKVYSESHIQKVKVGQKYVPEIADALIEIATENKEKFDRQISKLQALSE